IIIVGTNVQRRRAERGKMRNHIIPKAYQDGFVDANGKIWTYRKDGMKPFPATPNHTGVEKGYYSDQNEKYLAEQIEFPALEVMKKIRNRQSITSADKMLMASYLASFLMRVRAGEQRLKTASPKAFAEVFSEQNIINTFLAVHGQRPSAKAIAEAQALRKRWENNVEEEFFQDVLHQ